MTGTGVADREQIMELVVGLGVNGDAYGLQVRSSHVVYINYTAPGAAWLERQQAKKA